MPTDRQRLLILDLPCTARCEERRRELVFQARELVASPPIVRAFTFRNPPSDLQEGDQNIVLIPDRGVAS